MPFFDLSGQAALITGGAQGIGEAIALRLAHAGAKVAIGDINIDLARETAARIGREAGRRVLAGALDVTSPASAHEAVQSVIAACGRLDILVNNAGIGGKAAPLWEQSDDDWARVIAVNLTGVFNCSRAVIAHMRERRYGRIVNMASVAGKDGNPNMSAYSASKAGVIALTKSLAKEVATEGICVNSVTPAVIRTKILDQLTPAQVEYMTAKIPMRRTGEPEEIAAVVHFLSSPDCSFVTGQCYDASGGRSTY
jgi:3-oxoacyl-[acyl-carrier protein] reductase